ncbi:MAG: diguanylate cyclase [Candidatus Cloacimonetes bacterium]|jgi:diguanylate cyclase (GGDEF)-like protein/PAS domain S-box-containing protein|nr:diguanylate cyclase [Candidatus Cloacimonadota bacterium]MBT6993737.1 diguanylate cyclase [Candidatus Cloacimonadota bacterium]MBT7469779.1 diguanylate cyclase [Candidatus Cloacimonadota bacterium]
MKTKDFLSAIIKNSIVGIGVVDSNGKYTLVNSIWKTMFGYTTEEAYQLNLNNVTPFEDFERSQFNFEKLIKGEIKNFHLEREYIRKDGSTFWAAVSVSPIYEEDGSVESVIAFIVNIDEQKMAEHKLKKSYEQLKNYSNEITRNNKELEILARIDPLTEIYNRRGIKNEIEKEAYRAHRNKTPLLVAFGDLDNFKNINDEFGHDAGDFVLKEIAKIMLRVIRETDAIGRWGGEEFILVLPETNCIIGRHILERIRRIIDETIFEFKGSKMRMTITFGFCEYDTEGDVENCIKKADIALYKGKKSTKNCVVSGE